MTQTYFNENGVRTEIDIHATPDQIWQLLIDFNKYPLWHPYITAIKGEPKLKSKIKVTVKNEDSTSTKFSAYILELKSDELLSWGGSLGFIFRAKHYFILDPIDSTTVRFIQGEYWKGLFGKSFGGKIYKETYNRFNVMNNKVKELLEKRVNFKPHL